MLWILLKYPFGLLKHPPVVFIILRLCLCFVAIKHGKVMSSKKSFSKTRTLKVYDKILLRSSYATQQSRRVLLPEIRLMGKWLADCGFEPGQHIEVRQTRHKLIITPAWFEPER